jgi:hypothetical protein
MKITIPIKKKIIIGLLMIIPFNLFNQTKSKILLILPESNQISWNNQTSRILKNNKVSSDSAKVKLIGILRKVSCKGFQFKINAENIFQFSPYDSLYQRHVYNRLTNVNLNLPRFPEAMENYYLGRRLSQLSYQKLIAICLEYNYNYILSINKFEIISKSIWNRNTYLNIHIDLYNAQLNELAGNKGNIKIKLSNQIYFDTNIYMIKNEIEFYIQTILSTIHK